MHVQLLILFFFVTIILASPVEDVAYLHEILPERQIRPRQGNTPTAFTSERTANTEFGPPQTVTPPDPSATGTQTTTHDANTEIIPSANTGSAPPLITTDSRSANTEAVGPSTVSSGFAMPTGAVRMDAVLGAVVVGIAGMV